MTTRNSAAGRRPIPHDGGPPIIGNAFRARRDLLHHLRSLALVGPVVVTKGFGIEAVVMIGPDALERVLKNADDAFSSREGWTRFVDHVFPGAIMAMDGAQHRIQRRIMQAAFTKRALRDYVARMGPTITERVEAWAPGDDETLRVYPALKQLTLDVATSTFMGIAPGDDATRVNRAFVDAVEASIAVIRLDLWPLPFAKGVRGRRFLVERFRALLADKRGARLPDLFSQMCHAESEEGERFSDEEVIDHMIFVMMAAHDTSTSALSTMMYFLARDPVWQDRLRERALAAGGDELDYDALQAQEELGWAMMEALRLHPPLAVIPRRTTTAVDFAGYTIPAGTLVSVAPLLTHHDPAIYPDPERFDPTRFGPEREEHRRHRFAFAPFGGGPHVCIGQHFAALEVKAVMHRLLRRYRWSVPDGYRMPYQHMPIAKPRDGLPLRLDRL